MKRQHEHRLHSIIGELDRVNEMLRCNYDENKSVLEELQSVRGRLNRLLRDAEQWQIEETARIEEQSRREAERYEELANAAWLVLRAPAKQYRNAAAKLRQLLFNAGVIPKDMEVRVTLHDRDERARL